MTQSVIPSEYQIEYARMERYCASQEHCSFDVVRKLSEKSIPEEIIKNIILKLEEKKFLDNDRYCEAFTNDHVKLKKWGRQKIKSTLRSKNIPEASISIALNQIDELDYLANLKALFNKKQEELSKEKDMQKKKAKIMRFLASNGYEFDLIYSLF